MNIHDSILAHVPIGEVLFDCNYPEEPPDFIFGPEDVDFNPDIEDIQVGKSIFHFKIYNDARLS